MKMSPVLMATILCIFVAGAASADEALPQKCMAQFDKVAMCLPFVTEKAPAPTRDCCSAATALKDSDPACICTIIQQIHKGSSDAIKSMGVKEYRLLQLPSVCKLTNASVAECPRLLHLSPNSPDRAIFTNTSSTSSSANTSPVTGISSAMPSSSSNGFCHNSQLLSTTFVPIAIFFFFAFPLGIRPS